MNNSTLPPQRLSFEQIMPPIAPFKPEQLLTNKTIPAPSKWFDGPPTIEGLVVGYFEKQHQN